MSVTDYDVRIPIQYDWNHRHNYTDLELHFPHYYIDPNWQKHEGWEESKDRYFDAYTAVDDSTWRHMSAQYHYENNGHTKYPNTYSAYAYFKNPRKDAVAFTSSNCYAVVLYKSVASFQIRLNEAGYIGRTNQQLTLQVVQRKTYQQYSISSVVVYYKLTSESSYHAVQASVYGDWTNTTLTLAQSLAAKSEYNVYVVATSDAGTQATSNVITVSTNDAAAEAACISPAGEYTHGTVTFTWSHRTDRGAPQYAYDLQYSADNGSNWTTVASHVITQAKSTQTTIGESGKYLWRVRTYNQNDEAGAWASASFINVLPLEAPKNVISTTDGRPVVSWTSASQAAYQVQAVKENGNIAYDSGVIYSTQTEHPINQFFDNSIYEMRVRVYNALGEVSEWGKCSYQQNISAAPDFDVTLDDITGFAHIEVVENETFSDYYLCRNGKLIAKLEKTVTTGEYKEELGIVYLDYFAIGRTEYSVIGVTPGGNSNITTKSITIRFPYAMIITQSKYIIKTNKGVNNPCSISSRVDPDINEIKFVGDDKPSHYATKMKSETNEIIFFDEDNAAKSLISTIVFYGDNFGNGGWREVAGYSKKDGFVKNGAGNYENEVTLELKETKYEDTIRLDN